MTTLQNRPNSALLVVDVQNGVVAGTPRRDEVVANVGSLVEQARQERLLGAPGHRDRALALLRQASSLARSPEIRR